MVTLDKNMGKWTTVGLKEVADELRWNKTFGEAGTVLIKDKVHTGDSLLRVGMLTYITDKDEVRSLFNEKPLIILIFYSTMLRPWSC